MADRHGGRAARERLGEIHRRARNESVVAGELVLAGEQAGKVVFDSLEVEIAAELERMPPLHQRPRHDRLVRIRIRKTRAEVVLPEGNAVGDDHFGPRRVGLARLFVADEVEADVEHRVGADHPRIRSRQIVGRDLVVAGVLLRRGCAVALKVLARVVVRVKADAHAVFVRRVPVAFEQVDVVVESDQIRRQVLLQLSQRRASRIDVWRQNLILRIALAVEVGEEEQLVLLDWSADRAAELIEVIRVHREPGAIIGERIGVHPLVAVEPEYRTVEVIGPGLGDDVDGSPAGASDFGRVVVGVHLELLDGVLAEGVRTEAGSASRLSEEEIVGVAAVDQQSIRRATLAGEGQVAAASRVLHDAWRQRREVDKVASIDGQVGDGALADNCTGRRAGRLDHWGF